jgi:hypothetical protein
MYSNYRADQKNLSHQLFRETVSLKLEAASATAIRFYTLYIYLVVRFRSQAEAVTLGIVRFFLHILFLGTFMYVVCVKIQFKVCPKG